jgi:hypothetical protein
MSESGSRYEKMCAVISASKLKLSSGLGKSIPNQDWKKKFLVRRALDQRWAEGDVNLLVKLRAIDAVLVTLKIDGCSFAFRPTLIESAPNKGVPQCIWPTASKRDGLQVEAVIWFREVNPEPGLEKLVSSARHQQIDVNLLVKLRAIDAVLVTLKIDDYWLP